MTPPMPRHSKYARQCLPERGSPNALMPELNLPPRNVPRSEQPLSLRSFFPVPFGRPIAADAPHVRASAFQRNALFGNSFALWGCHIPATLTRDPPPAPSPAPARPFSPCHPHSPVPSPLANLRAKSLVWRHTSTFPSSSLFQAGKPYNADRAKYGSPAPVRPRNALARRAFLCYPTRRPEFPPWTSNYCPAPPTTPRKCCAP